MDAETTANKARRAISGFCLEECRCYCCRKGNLVMTLDEAMLVTQGKAAELVKQGKITITATGKYCMDMGKIEGGCPSLKDYRCTVHNKKKRPKTCREFPIFVDAPYVKISSRCPAVTSGMLYPYIYKLRMMGYKVIEGSNYADSHLYDVIPDPKETIPKAAPKPKEPDDDGGAVVET
ncbi:YkgJ family cysteine cluster protein [Candidatus Woesearchaeota archaeon]|nr:YkgJ family cysteine cluster protein [Candidatus Woesearchaeota archaeon]